MEDGNLGLSYMKNLTEITGPLTKHGPLLSRDCGNFIIFKS